MPTISPNEARLLDILCRIFQATFESKLGYCLIHFRPQSGESVDLTIYQAEPNKRFSAPAMPLNTGESLVPSRVKNTLIGRIVINRIMELCHQDNGLKEGKNEGKLASRKCQRRFKSMVMASILGMMVFTRRENRISSEEYSSRSGAEESSSEESDTSSTANYDGTTPGTRHHRKVRVR